MARGELVVIDGNYSVGMQEIVGRPSAEYSVNPLLLACAPPGRAGPGRQSRHVALAP
jgi:hypothetical protein